MKTFAMAGAAALFCATGLFAQPSLRANNPVVNGGSYAAGIAQGSIFVVFGSNIAGATLVQATALPLQTTMSGTSIRFTPVGGGTPVDALMIYTTQNQIAGLLPSTAAAGDYNVTVSYNNQTTAPAKVTVVARNFGIVSADGSGAGQAQVQDYRTGVDWDLNRFAKGRLGPFTTAPAAPGHVLVIWGTGIGADAPSDAAGGTSGDRTGAASVRVIVGDKEITPAYAGRALGFPGTDQINLTLPADVQLGCSVPLQVRAGGTLSNTVTLSIANPGDDACSHPFLTGDALKRLSEGGTVTLGTLSLAKQAVSLSALGISLDTTTETASGNFARFTVGSIGNYSGVLTTTSGCQVFRRTGGQQDLLFGTAPTTALDAGAQLTLNGPGATNIALPRDAQKSYNKTLYSSGILGSGAVGTPVINAGNYTIAGTGGADIGAFTASLTVPTPINWVERTTITNVNRSQGVTVNWTGGGSDNLVEIVGISGQSVGGTATNPIFDAGIFICLAPASALKFTVPSSVLMQLPATTGDLTSGSVGLLGVQLVVPGVKFNAPLTAGGTVDYATFNFTNGGNKSVSYQ